MAAPRKKSASGYWEVEISRRFPLHDFNYLPGQKHTVDETTLAAMRAEDDLIISAAPAPAAE